MRAILVFLFTAATVIAQDFRVTAPERAVQMRVQVLYASGTALYDSDWKSGNILDVNALPYGSYQLLISSRDVDGKVTEKSTALQVAPDRTRIDPALPDDLKLTMTAHDGTTGQIITTSGDLSFRFGDYLNKKDTEAMRLSPEGNLEVQGWIKAGQGFVLADGSTVDVKKLKAKADAAGTGTLNQVAKWGETGGAGTLIDSAIAEVSGNVGIGTATPTGKLHVFGAATADVFAGLGTDMVAGPAFNFGYGGASFGRGAGFLNARPAAGAVAPNPSIRFLTANVERMIVANNGNVGIGTSTPSGKLHIFGNPTEDVFAGMGVHMISGPAFNFGYGGATFGRGAGFFNVRPDASASAPNPSLRFMTVNAERMIITNTGDVGIATSAPSQRLEVNGNIALPASSAIGGGIYIGGARFAHRAGSGNTFVGEDAGDFGLTGQANTGIGYHALMNSGTGGGNTAIGQLSMEANTVGHDNVAVGASALESSVNGTDNIAIGNASMSTSNNTHNNVAIGVSTLVFNAADNNTAVGTNSLNFNSTGQYNTGFGIFTLFQNTTGAFNTASGGLALQNNTTASGNSAFGYAALSQNSTGTSNTAVGQSALGANTIGNTNIAVGNNALANNTTGIGNLGIGPSAGITLTTGSNNVYIANSSDAGSTESGFMRIGASGVQTKTFIAGIRNVTTGTQDAVNVMIDSNGQLGTTSSSIRYKFDVADMAETTTKLMDLRPVTFRYRQFGDEAKRQYGLIAEEVAKIYPEMVVNNKDGQPETVMYQFLAPMLLNETQKQHQKIELQQQTISDQQKTIDRLVQRLDALEKQLATR